MTKAGLAERDRLVFEACERAGLPLAITMAGACEHCGAYLASGDFDWVLSKIEQDDTYRG